MRMLLSFCATAMLLTAAAYDVPFKEYKLKNGLRVILSEDHSAPTYSISVTYNAGSRDEKPGRTGVANLLERLMFPGSENAGVANVDRTIYFGTLPSNQLDLGLLLEAERMKAPAIDQASFDKRRDVLREERRLAIDNRPYGNVGIIVNETAFDSFGYKHPTIGSAEDLNAANLSDVQSFHKSYYAPNNAAMAIVGDFRSDELMKKVDKYFGVIASQPGPPQPDIGEPEQRGERRKTITDPLAQLGRIDIVFKAPGGASPDIYALDLLTDVIGGGPSSRMYQTLVKEKEVAIQPIAGLDPHQKTSLVIFAATLPPGKQIDALEKALENEIALFQTEPVREEELARVRTRAKAAKYSRLRSSLDRATQLSDDAVLYSDAGRINTYESNYNKVTAADVQRVAKKYLTEANRTVIITVPKAQSR